MSLGVAAAIGVLRERLQGVLATATYGLFLLWFVPLFVAREAPPCRDLELGSLNSTSFAVCVNASAAFAWFANYSSEEAQLLLRDSTVVLGTEVAGDWFLCLLLVGFVACLLDLYLFVKASAKHVAMWEFGPWVYFCTHDCGTRLHCKCGSYLLTPHRWLWLVRYGISVFGNVVGALYALHTAYFYVYRWTEIATGADLNTLCVWFLVSLVARGVSSIVIVSHPWPTDKDMDNGPYAFRIGRYSTQKLGHRGIRILCGLTDDGQYFPPLQEVRKMSAVSPTAPIRGEDKKKSKLHVRKFTYFSKAGRLDRAWRMCPCCRLRGRHWMDLFLLNWRNTDCFVDFPDGTQGLQRGYDRSRFTLVEVDMMRNPGVDTGYIKPSWTKEMWPIRFDWVQETIEASSDSALHCADDDKTYVKSLTDKLVGLANLRCLHTELAGKVKEELEKGTLESLFARIRDDKTWKGREDLLAEHVCKQLSALGTMRSCVESLTTLVERVKKDFPEVKEEDRRRVLDKAKGSNSNTLWEAVTNNEKYIHFVSESLPRADSAASPGVGTD